MLVKYFFTSFGKFLIKKNKKKDVICYHNYLLFMPACILIKSSYAVGGTIVFISFNMNS